MQNLTPLKGYTLEYLNEFFAPVVIIDKSSHIVDFNWRFEVIFDEQADAKELSLLKNYSLYLHEVGSFISPSNTFCTDGWQEEILRSQNFKEYPFLLSLKRSNIFYSLKIKKIVTEHDETLYAVFFLKMELPSSPISKDKHIVMLIDDDKECKNKIRELLAIYSVLLIDLESFKMVDRVLDGFCPSVIFINRELKNTNIFKEIEQLMENGVTAHSNIVIVSDFDSHESSEKYIKTGASAYLTKSVDVAELKEKLDKYLKEPMVCNRSYFKKTSRALVKLCDSEYNATRMLLKMTYVIRELGNPKFECPSSACLVDMLSASLKTHTESQVLAFVRDLSFPSIFTNSLMNTIGSSSPEYLVPSLILQAEKSFIAGQKISFEKSKMRDEKIEELVLKSYQNYIYAMTNGKDAEYVWRNYIRQISDIAELDITQIGLFGEYIYTLLVEMLILGDGGIASLSITDEKVIFNFQPFKVGKSREDKIRNYINSNKESFDVFIKEADGKLTISAEIAFEQMKNDTTESETTQIPSAPEPKEKKSVVNAAEFLAQADIDPDDIRNLRALEDDISELVDTLEISGDKNKICSRIGTYLKSYGTQIMYLREFMAISNELVILGDKFGQIDFERIEESNAIFLPMLFTNIINDLKKWREDIFVNKIASDVHFLDASIIAGCKQCAMVLDSGSGLSEVEEIEFF